MNATATRTAGAARTRSSAASRAYERRIARRSEPGVVAGSPASRLHIDGRVGFVALLLVLLGGGLAATLLLTTASAEGSYQLSAARSANTELAQRKASLEREVESANSAPVLAQAAASLGMVPAVDPARLVVAPDGGVAVVGTAKPADGVPPAPLDKPVQTRAAQATTGQSGAPTTSTDRATESRRMQLSGPGAATTTAPATSAPVTTAPAATAPAASAPATSAPATPTPAAAASAPATPDAAGAPSSRSEEGQLVPVNTSTATGPTADATGAAPAAVAR